MLYKNWKYRIRQGFLDRELESIYGGDTERQRLRYESLLEEFADLFGDDVCLISAPGRTELAGNHTDHQNGIVLCAAVTRDMVAAVSPRDDGRIRIISHGFSEISLDLDSFEPQPEETGTSEGIVRGIASGFRKRGSCVGGFNAVMTSDVPAGGGLSSSAAFEILIGTVFSHLYNNDCMDALSLAVIAQSAERSYFGKPSGLMDQTASACGGITKIDFADPVHPDVERLNFDFRSGGYVLCAVDTHTSHAGLTDDYASIPTDMMSVASFFGSTVLREVDPAVFRASMGRSELSASVSRDALLRAEHFFEENERVGLMASALACGDMQRYISNMNASGFSSREKLRNVIPSSHPERTEMADALDRAEERLSGKGAWRIHGGGFAGCIQCLVPVPDYPLFSSSMDGIYGPGSCFELRIRPCGPHILGSGQV